MNKKVVFLISILFFMMLVYSLVMNVVGALVPTFKNAFEIRNTQIGVFFFLGSLFYMIGSYIGAGVINKFGRKNTLYISSAVTIVGIVSIIISKSVVLFYTYSILTSLGISTASLVINTMIIDIEVKSKAVLINTVHFLYAIGAILTHKFSGYLLHYNIDYRYVFVTYAVFAIITVVLIYFANVPKQKSKVSNEKIKFNSSEKRLIIIISVALGFYVSAELQTANWYLNYIVNDYKLSITSATTYTAFFFLTFAFGRLFGGFVAEKVGYLKSVILSSLVGSVIFLIGMMLRVNGLIIISISGVFFSIVFPTIVLSISNYFKRSLNQATGITLALASAINMMMGFLMGYISDYIGVYSAMMLIPIFLIICSVLILYVEKKGDKLLKEE